MSSLRKKKKQPTIQNNISNKMININFTATSLYITVHDFRVLDIFIWAFS